MISDELRNKWNKKVNAIKEAIENKSIDLNDWEISFIDSIDIQLNSKKDISFKQSSILSKIYDKIE